MIADSIKSRGFYLQLPPAEVPARMLTKILFTLAVIIVVALVFRVKNATTSAGSCASGH